ncbi:lipocalin family protein [Capnocytophaga sp. 051621]|uniref:Lipocalin family protein n=1 Tax=Capnocytophaga periodontitidis TaxID=2795027 RepID=A0ABS0SJP0_9FLAO|nr:lipocalin family protein [Capnocytophaga periodontitidis]MBI1645949.1 lipocalin family protein [Capnocytophaga periodontitidis]
MKKLIFSALVATTLFVSSCGKDDDNGGGSTSLTGDWYEYVFYNGSRWNFPNTCSEQTHWSISDKKMKHERYALDNSNNCEHTSDYYDYTTSNGTFNLTVSDDSPGGGKGGTTSIKYEMKDKELILHYKINGGDRINVLHKKDVNYSHLDPFIGVWNMTKATVGQEEYIVQQGKCLDGQVVASSFGFTLYLKAPDKSGQCQNTITTCKWVKEGGKYYDVTDPQKKEELVFVFSENNTKLSYSTPSDNGLVTIYLTKVR